MRTLSLSSVWIFLSVITAANCQVKIVHTNDDGWAVANIRAQDTALVNAGFNVVLSAPAENKSGTGSSDSPPTPVGSSGCEFSSCPPNSPAVGANASNPRLNYVNSFPVTSVRYGIQTASPPFFGGTGPDFVVSGPNVGNNLGSVVLESGTVGAACEAAKEGIPSVAFSGDGGSQVSYTTLSTSSSSTTTANVFAQLGLTFTQAILAKSFGPSNPILPPNITVNVNYPKASGSCSQASAFKFVFTRINSATSSTPPDVSTCGSTRLPTESSVVATSGCFASVSVMNATTKGDVDASTQEFVLNRIGSSFFSCV